MVLGHEAFVHVDKDADALNKIDRNIKEKTYSKRRDYINDEARVANSANADHNALGDGKVTKFENYSKQLTKQKKDTYYEEEYKRQVERY